MVHKHRSQAAGAKPPWVVADWKHRLPDPSAPVTPRPLSPSRAQQAKAMERHMRLVKAEHASINQTILDILQRCEVVRQTFGAPTRPHTAAAAAAAAAAPRSPLAHISMRSAVLFHQPPPPPPAAAAAGDCRRSPSLDSSLLLSGGGAVAPAWAASPLPTRAHQPVWSSRGSGTSLGGAGNAAAAPSSSPLISTPQTPLQQAGAVHRQAAVVPGASWQQQQGQEQQQGGASAWQPAVDLNPGLSFRPGSPQRLEAVCPGLTEVLAGLTSVTDAVRQLDLQQLSHREVLQAGIQRLNGEWHQMVLRGAATGASAAAQ